MQKIFLVILINIINLHAWGQHGSFSSVAIGTAGPDQIMTINASTGNNSLVSLKQSEITKAYVGLGMDGVFRNQTLSGTELQLRADGSSNFISLYTNGLEKMRLTSSGNVGIGTAAPSSPFTVVTATAGDIALFKATNSNNNRIVIANNVGQVNLGMGLTSPHAYLWSSTNKFFIGNDGAPTIFVDGMANGNVGIGTANPQSKLAVNGDMFAKKIKVTQTGWPDYVFETGYPLLSLKEVEQFIQHNKHLPDVPSAKEVETNGLNLGDNQAILLKKIEEITIYLIQKDKEVELLNRKLAKQEQLITDLQTRLSVLHPKN